MSALTVGMIRKAAEQLRKANIPQPRFWKGIVHPLRYEWLRWNVDPMYSDMTGNAWGINHQLEADYLGYGINAVTGR